MAPPEAACQVIAQTKQVVAEIRDRIKNIKKIIKDIISAKTAIKFGLIFDAIGADVLAAIQSAAGSIASAALGAVSGAVATAFESIISALLTVFMSGPTALLTLVAIPYKKALENTQMEVRSLSKAQGDIEAVYSIFDKWKLGFRSAKYYEQMRESLGDINRAIRSGNKVIRSLNGDQEMPGDQRNAVFDQTSYNTMKFYLDSAIKKSKPDSAILNNERINKIVERRKEQILAETLPPITEQYRDRMASINEEYQDNMRNIDTGSVFTQASYAAQVEVIKSRYNIQKNASITWRDTQRTIARGKAEVEARADANTYLRALGGVAADFSADVENVARYLNRFVGNISDAYRYNKRSQSFCNTVYNIQGLVRTLLNEIIDLLRSAGNQAADAVIASLQTSISRMEITAERYDDAINRYLSGNISSSGMSLKLGAGWMNLVLADNLTNAMVVDSLVDLINKDDVLEDENGDLEKLTNALLEIPDWDGNLNNWVADPLSSGVSPYLNITLNSSQLLLKMPSLLVAQDEDSVNEAKNTLNTLREDFNTARRHAFIVNSKLNEYAPYTGQELGNLESALRSAGMLNTFANGMSILSVSNEMIGMVSDLFNADTPTVEACREAYPEMFDSEEISKGYTSDKYNINHEMLNINNQAIVENNLDDIRGTRDYIDNIDVFKLYMSEDSDLYSDSAAT